MLLLAAGLTGVGGALIWILIGGVILVLLVWLVMELMG